MARRERVWIGRAVLIGMGLGYIWALYSPKYAVFPGQRIVRREYGFLGYYSVTTIREKHFAWDPQITVKQVYPRALAFTLLATFAVTACCWGCVYLDWTKRGEPDRNR